MAAYTTANLLTDINARSFIPAGQQTFTNAELLRFANDELDTYVLPKLLSLREEYLVHYTEIPLVADQREYEIPDRAIGVTVRELHLISGGTTRDLPRIEPEQARPEDSGDPDAFYLRDNKIVLQPIPQSNDGSLRLYFHIQPGDMVETSEAAVISSIDSANKIITVSSIPSTWNTGTVLDLAKGSGGQQYYRAGTDLTSTLISGTSITLPSIPDGLSVGDYVTQARESALVQVPRELRPILAQFTSARLLESMSQPGASKARDEAKEMLENVIGMYAPRTPGANRKILTAVHTWGIGARYY